MSDGAPIPADELSDPERAQAAWERYITRTGLADKTKSTYAGEVRQFVRWLLQQTEFHLDEVFTSTIVRDQVVRVYRRELNGRRAATGVDTAMAAIGNLYAWTGLGAAKIKSSGKPETAPKALTPADAGRVIRAAERRGPRDMALLVLALHCGLRVSELADLDVDDVWSSAQKGQVQVRRGKGRDGGKQREVPLTSDARKHLKVWLEARKAFPGADREHEGRRPLFLTREGTRISPRTIRYVVNECGRAVGVDVGPHVLRHTMATAQVRGGTSLPEVQALLGHESVTTTARYSKPSKAEMAAAVERHAIKF